MTGFVRDLPLLAMALVGTGIAFLSTLRFSQLANAPTNGAAWFTVGAGFTISTVLIVTATFVSFARVFRRRHARLAAATGTTAEVVAIDAKGVPGEEGYRETPVVRFTTAEGRVLQARPVFEQLTPKGLKQGDTVDVRYDPADPGWLVIGDIDYGITRPLKWGVGAFVGCWLIVPLAFCIYKGLTAVDLVAAPPVKPEPRTAPRRNDVSTGQALFVVLIFGGFAAAMAWDGRRRYAKWRQRFGRSHEVNATIVKVNLNVGGTIRNAQPVYHFKGLDGQEMTAASAHLHTGWRPAKLFTVGSSTRVRYDPDEPRWVVGSEVTVKVVRRRCFVGALGFGLAALASAALFFL